MTVPAAIRKYLMIFDMETYYDKDYSLRKMSPPEYILDPKFELQMVAVKVVDITDYSHLDDEARRLAAVLNDRFNPDPRQDHFIVDGADFAAFLAQYPAEHTTTVSFNSLFDNSILAWRYGYVPHTMIDVMGMARALLGHKLTSFSLKSIADFLHLGAKGGALANMMGKRAAEIKAAGLWPSFEQYALQDNYLCEQIFYQLYHQFPTSERRIMDMVLRCAVEPAFHVDKKLLEDNLVLVRQQKADLLAQAGLDTKTVMSTPKFKAWLESQGVEVEMKVSPTTGKETPAFAKTDAFMEELQEHADPIIAAAAAARLGLKSTLEETRAQRLLNIANCNWAGWATHNGMPNDVCYMPIPLRYGGAHTHRLSGEWSMNMQNMPTVRGSKGKSKLRQSLIVADDEEVVTCDLSQIEARLVAWICGCTRLVDEFANKRDPYSLLAQDIFQDPQINRKLKDANGNAIYEIEGFIGKTGILGLGYGCGKDNFDTMVTRSARSMGLDITGKYDRAIGDRGVDSYRSRYPEIPRTWNVLNQVLATHWLSGSSSFKFGPTIISYGNVLLPSGLSLRYGDPATKMNEQGRAEHVYRYGKFQHRIYGAKVLENIVQALARIVVMNAALRIRGRGLSEIFPQCFRFRLQAHDELVFIVKKIILEEAKAVILEEMTRRPSWAPDAPIDAELGQGASYGAAK